MNKSGKKTVENTSRTNTLIESERHHSFFLSFLPNALQSFQTNSVDWEQTA